MSWDDDYERYRDLDRYRGMRTTPAAAPRGRAHGGREASREERAAARYRSYSPQRSLWKRVALLMGALLVLAGAGAIIGHVTMHPLSQHHRQSSGVPAADAAPVLLPVDPYDQRDHYPTGCEIASLYMLLSYYGVNTSMEELANAIPKEPLPYVSGGVEYGGNPDRGFVGDPTDVHSFGVFQAPIAQTANGFRKGAEAKEGASMGDIYRCLDKGNPVIAWISSRDDGTIEHYRNAWIDCDTGERILWPSYEHAVLVCGYDEGIIWACDPLEGKLVSINASTFEKAFDDMNGRIVWYDA